MKPLNRCAGASALALMMAVTGAHAQTAISGIDTMNDRIDDISTDANKDIRRAQDDRRFGNPDYRPGLSGSASLGYSGKTGNNETQDFSAGARLRYAKGRWVHTIGVALDFSDVAGSSTKEDVFGVYDANYYFSDRFYGFGLARVETDGLANTAGTIKTDAFVGFGPGYRVVNSEDMTWRVQAGIGISYLENGLGVSDTEPGYLLSSRYYMRLTPTLFATNDTDVLKSDSALRINNDLGLNFKVSDQFATRVSYLTEYNDSRSIRADNKLGVSLVYGF